MGDLNSFRIGITPDFAGDAKEALESMLETELAGFAWEFLPAQGAAASREVLDRYDAVIALALHFPRESLESVRRLALIARWGVGCDRIDLTACTENDVMVAITPRAIGRPVAEGILTLIFGLAKNLHALEHLCRTGGWRDQLPVTWSVQDKTLGSVGAGNIARELFHLARGVDFGRLLAYDPFIPEAPEGVELVPLEILLRESDFVAVNCPLTERTRRLIGAAELSLMKPTAFLINTARGPIVDQKALVKALQDKVIAGAGLDVFEVEPLPADDPLLQLDNVMVSPHAIAWTRELLRDNSYHACRNVREFLDGRAPEYLANPEVLQRPGCQAKLSR